MRTVKKKILIVTSADDLAQSILGDPKAKNYHFELAKTGAEALDKIAEFKPDLLFTGLLLSDMHMVAIMKELKANPKTKKIGIIVAANYPMSQNYHAAMSAGANYFLLRPFKPALPFQLFEKFFAKKLKPNPFYFPNYKTKTKRYAPTTIARSSYIKFWGTRGSTAVSGAEYVRYGGNSSCLEIRDRKTLLIIDSGTGIRALGKTVKKTDKTIHILLGHTHLDHIVGFPFFDPIYDPSCHITLWAPLGFEKDTKEFFTDVLAHTLFPVRLDDMQAKLTFKPLIPSKPIRIGRIKISTHYTCHPGPTLCFKFEIGKTTFGYVTDNEILMGYTGHPNQMSKDDERLTPFASLIAFLQGCDFLVHEAQYSPFEYLTKIGWGHSSVANTAILLKNTKTRKWYATHHDPSHTDEDLFAKHLLHQQILDECGIDCQANMAYDGLILPIN